MKTTANSCMIVSLGLLMCLLAGCSQIRMESEYNAVGKAPGVPATWMPEAEASVGRIRVSSAGTNKDVQGTGFLVAPNLLVTCFHVVSQANFAEITFPSGVSRPITGIVAEDVENDLVILTIMPTGAEPPPLPLARVPPRVGDRLVMYGFPAAGQSQKACEAKVTCVGPSYGMGAAIITISTQLAHGFSGGPAINSLRQVVGVSCKSDPPLAFMGKEIGRRRGILAPASRIASLTPGPSRSLQEWVRTRGDISSAAAEANLGDRNTDREEDYATAIQHFQKAIQLNPNSSPAWFHMGEVFVWINRDKQAMDAFRKALALNSQFPEALMMMGALFLKQQRYSEAVRSFEKSLQIQPNSDRGHCFLGLAYAADGRPDKARQQYQALKPINPEAAAFLLNRIEQTYTGLPSTTQGVGLADKNAQLIRAAYDGDLKAVQALLAGGAEVNAGTNNGVTALRQAAQNGHLEIVKYLIEKGADVHAKDVDGVTTLCVAADKGELEVAKLLLKKGADVNSKSAQGAAPLIQAAQNGHAETVRLLLEEGADVNIRRTDGSTPLFMAAQNGRAEVVRLLLKRGADVNAKKYSGGWTALMVASALDRADVVMLLLKNGADVNAKADAGTTALDLARSQHHIDIVRLLEKAGLKK